MTAETPIAPAREQGFGAGRERRAGGHDVVDEDDPAAREGSGSRGARTEAEGARDVRRAVLTVEIELGDGGAAALEDRRHREAELARGDLCDQGGLVVAALPGALGVHGHRDEDVAARAGSPPAPGDGPPERFSKAALAAVLQLVEGPPDGTGERRAPLELEQRFRDVRREPDRDAGRELEAGIERRLAAAAQRRPLPPATDAARGQGKVEGPADEVAHPRMVARAPLRALTR